MSIAVVDGDFDDGVAHVSCGGGDETVGAFELQREPKCDFFFHDAE